MAKRKSHESKAERSRAAKKGAHHRKAVRRTKRAGRKTHKK